MTPSLLIVVSLPRSGSTVLTSMLDRYEGVICLPESGFPQALEFAGEKILHDPRQAAALYHASSFGGTVLNLAEAEPCIRPDAQQTFIQLGLASAEKLGRPTASIRAVVWKTTRMISRWKSLAAMGARFVVLHRELRNVFESQFRVDFGAHNRNPVRFAAFAASYDAIFRKYPQGTRFLSYTKLDEEMKDLVKWLGLEGHLREAGPSSLEGVSSRFDFHTTILDKFQNRDAEKASRISRRQASLLSNSYRAFVKLGPLWNTPRLMADRKVFRGCQQRAAELISSMK